uniref:UBC core domain-containing protein n=1 Tax=Neobodo designis TaxID=312471 RepID=A0A7S1LYF9_NEODS
MPRRLDFMQQELQSFAERALRGDFREALHVVPLPDFTGYEGLVAVTSPASPWFGGVFQFWVLTPAGYPANAPTVRFAQELRHPNLEACVLDVSDLFDSGELGDCPLAAIGERVLGLFEMTVDIDGRNGASELVSGAQLDVDELSTLPRHDPDAIAFANIFAGDQRTWCIEAQACPSEHAVPAKDALRSVTQEQMLTDRLLSHVVPKVRSSGQP